jgi:MFS family permease
MPAPPPSESSSLRSVGAALVAVPVLVAVWLVALPSLLAGVLNVLAPLRLSDLGASGVAIGAVFLVAAGVEAFATRAAGSLSDRRGRALPIRAGLAASGLAAIVLPLPDAVLVLAVAVVGAVLAMSLLWAPAMALLSDAGEAIGLDQGFAFALVNLAWAGGQVLGGSAGSNLAEAHSDALPYVLVAALFALTLAALAARLRLRPAP